MSFNLAGTLQTSYFPPVLQAETPAVCSVDSLTIEVFDAGTPGEGARLFTRPSKRSKDRLRGMFPPFSANYSSEAPNMHDIFFSLFLDYPGLYVAGTFSSSIGLLSEEIGEDILLYLAMYLVRLHRYKSLLSETAASANLASTPSCNSIPQGRAFSLQPASRHMG